MLVTSSIHFLVVGEQRIHFEVSERGNPEGESTEPSMESGSTKLPTTNLLAPIGLTKNTLPRTLVFLTVDTILRQYFK